MFWCPEDRDSIQRTFVLTQPMRTKDRWLRAVLDAERVGEEPWEMYCFIHGLPTRNVGTWMPNEDKPWCGNSACAILAETKWADAFKRGRGSLESWKFRTEMECLVCQTERRRRCCVLRPSHEEHVRRLQDPPFDVAPYVHPFRYPSFHATQLRAISFAKSNHKQVFWVPAYDKAGLGEGISKKETITSNEHTWSFNFGEPVGH